MVINKKQYTDLVYYGSNISRNTVVGTDALVANMNSNIKQCLLIRMYNAMDINDGHFTNGVLLLRSFSQLRLLRFANRVVMY